MRENRIISRLDEMLTDAINGSFVETDYNETELSRLESRFRQYLTEKELSAERVQAERAAIKELVTDISHQTRNPVANICLYTQLLEEICTEETAPYVRQIRQQAEKLEFLIRALTQISRLESDMVRLAPKPGPVFALVDRAVREVQERAREKQITIEAEGVNAGGHEAEEDVRDIEDVHDVRAVYDGRWTGEALGNLLDNALKYSPAGSRIRVRVRPFEMFVCISVEDEGPGIPEEERAQIFERFYRGKNAMQQEGSGVGLYLTRMILRKEGGYIRVSSGEKKGSCFQMFLPRQAREESFHK